ncbi:DUF262 domain-containing HNH endonuclease family protein [Kocuria sp. CPCC 205292]|uniref:DUF262 domain-containing protein n=1 Tax=Kocuria cellulosilytica TaxID=3071451 RepID=UPI0034D671FB
MSRLLNPKTLLAANTVTLGQLLKEATYEIPDYQRDFSWGEDELQKLWDDIVHTWHRAFIGGQLATDIVGHFLGAVVTQQPANKKNEPEVIDGQQRLTSISVLLSVLYEFANKIEDENMRTNVVTQLLALIAEPHASGRDPKLRLAREQDFYSNTVVQKLTIADREAYWATVSLDKQPVRQRIRDAVRFFHKKVVATLEKKTADHDAVISQLVEVVTGGMMVLHLEVVDHRMAYKVFETLNFRGLALSQADLIKNELVRRADVSGDRQHVVSDWEEVAKNLDKVKKITLVEFLQYHFVSKYKQIRAGELFEAVTTHLNTSSLTAKEYTQDLVEESSRLVQLVEGDTGWSTTTNENLEEIRDTLNQRFAYPILMSIAARFMHAPDSLETWTRRIRDFCFRYVVIGRNPLGSFESVITEAARNLRNSSICDSVVLDYLQTASPDAVFVKQFAEATVSTNKMGFYIIRKIEDSISAGSGKTFPQGSAQHLEHIMPKKPQIDWTHVSEDPNYDSYLYRIGNLLGLEQPINSHIKNKAFKYKLSNPLQKDYEHSMFALPKITMQFVNKSEQWDFDSIESRQFDMATKYAVQAWSLK